MTVTIGGIISWLAPILSTIIITAATVSIYVSFTFVPA